MRATLTGRNLLTAAVGCDSTNAVESVTILETSSAGSRPSGCRCGARAARATDHGQHGRGPSPGRARWAPCSGRPVIRRLPGTPCATPPAGAAIPLPPKPARCLPGNETPALAGVSPIGAPRFELGTSSPPDCSGGARRARGRHALRARIKGGLAVGHDHNGRLDAENVGAACAGSASLNDPTPRRRRLASYSAESHGLSSSPRLRAGSFSTASNTSACSARRCHARLSSARRRAP